MGQYYSNSLLTLSAVAATDGSRGIFFDRDPRVLSPCPIDIRFPSSSDAGSADGEVVSGFLHPSFDWDPSRDTFQYETQRPPLWQRAWVQQERILSPRLLMFSDAQMSWLCRCEEASEGMPEGRQRTRDHSAEEREMQAARLGLRRYRLSGGGAAAGPSDGQGGHAGEGTAAELERLYNAWYDLVSSYTKCGLTVASDIFPAISGIAGTIARATGDDYVAGLWRGDLHRGLLWTAADSTKNKADLRHYRAPSWSWASLPATLNFIFRQMILSGMDTSPLAIQSVEMTVDQLSPFGEVRGGLLSAVGYLKKAHPAPSDPDHREDIFRRLADSRLSESLFDLEAQVRLGYYWPDNQDRENLTEVWCSPVVSTDPLWHAKEGSKDWYCLAMVRLRDGPGGGGTFMRVGLAWIKDADWFNGCERASFCII